MPQTTLEQQDKMAELYNNKTSLSKISKLLKIPKSTVASFLKRYKEDPRHLKTCRKSGRPRVLTPREEDNIVLKSRKFPKLTSRQLLSSLPSPKKASTSFIRRLLIKHGLYSRTAYWKPILSQQNKKKRLDFVQIMLQKQPIFGKMWCFLMKPLLNSIQIERFKFADHQNRQLFPNIVLNILNLVENALCSGVL